MLADKIPYPVQWSEGMLLSPQHFQQQHIYIEKLLHHQMQHILPHYWGLFELAFEESALASGQINIKKISAVMPDGTVLDYDEKIDAPLTLDLKKAIKLEEDKSVAINLVIPIRAPGAASEKASIKRFDSIEGDPVVDENTNEGQIIIHRLCPKIDLLASDNPPKRYVSLPLFRVEYSRDGAYKLTAYMPPLLRISADSFMESVALSYRLSKLLTLIREKAMQLSDISRVGQHQIGQSITHQHQEVIHCLVSELPQLEILLSSGTAHPLEVYLALARMTGQMAALSKNLIPPLLPKYNHNNLRPGFEKAIQFIRPLLDEINLAYTAIDFNEDQEGVFSIELDKACVKNTSRLVIELRGSKDQSKPQLAEWLINCRIASKDMFKKLGQHRLLGAKASPIQRDDELGIVSANDGMLASITNDANFITPGQPLIIVNMDPTQSRSGPQKITFYLPHQTAS